MHVPMLDFALGEEIDLLRASVAATSADNVLLKLIVCAWSYGVTTTVYVPAIVLPILRSRTTTSLALPNRRSRAF